MRSLLPFAALLIASCGTSEGEGDDIDYAAINGAAAGPAYAIELDPITFEEMDKHDILDSGCNVIHGEGGPLLLAQRKSAHFLLDGELVTLAAHPGSGELPFGYSANYDGREYSAEIEVDLDSEVPEPPMSATYDGTLTIRDSKERVVFERVSC